MAARRCLEKPNHACFKVKLNTPARAWHCGRLWCTITNVVPAWFLGVILLLLLYSPTFYSPSNLSASDLQSPPICLTLNRVLMCVCLWQGLWRHRAFHPEVRPLLRRNESRLVSLPPELLHWPVWLLILLSWREHHFKPHPLLLLLGFFLSWLFFFLCCVVLVFLSFSSCWWTFGRVLGLCVSLCVCVFSPAASVDYGSFADRCSTWLELLRLKAHTIRRGSVKTSRRTHSLAHPDDHTYRFTSSSCTRARIHAHTPPCMPLGAEPDQSSNQALALFFW